MLPELPRSEWSPARAAHLLNRAGFGASPSEIRAAAARAPGDVVEELLQFDAIPEAIAPPAFTQLEGVDQRPRPREMRSLTPEERQQRQREERMRQGERIVELRGWWIERMRATRRPLQEKLTLFWHGHFATSIEKVRNAYPLYVQNQTLRTHCAGNFEALVTSVAQDPAMLVYLDNAQSRPRQPNENFARELMELFTLGEGAYTEDDIQNAARAFCGWTLQPDTFRFADLPGRRDTGTKTLFSQTGPFTGKDAIRIILQQRSMAPFICRKLWTFFACEDPPAEIVDGLAAELTRHRGELKPVLRAMFRSRAFYSERAVRTQIKSPAQWLVGALRALQGAPPAQEVCAGMLAALGQDLFAPPNVKGWPGGYTWITTDTLLKRYNLAGFLVKGGHAMTRGRANDLQAGGGPLRARVARAMAAMPPSVDPSLTVPSAERADPDRLVRYLEWMLFQAPLRDAEKSAVKSYLAHRSSGPLTDEHVRDLLHIMMSTPHYQLT